MDTNDIFWQLTRGVRFGKSSQYNTIKMGLQYQLPDKSQKQPESTSEAVNDEASTPGAPIVSTAEEPTVSADELRRVNRIRVEGSDVPRPIVEFSQLASRYDVSPRLLHQLNQLGYHEPTPVQQQAVPLMLERREVLVCAPTGSGKTAAYLVPLLHQLAGPRGGGCRALVVAPSRELARQIALEATRLCEGSGVRVKCLDRVKQPAAAVPGGKQPKVLRCDLLVTTPNRLIFLLDSQPAAISLSRVQWLVVDESDKLFEEGARGFRDQLGRIYSACDSGQVRRALFSATFAQDVSDWCRLQLDSVVSVVVGLRNAACDIIEQQLVFAGDESGKLYALRNIVQNGLITPCLIFVQTRERAKELFRELIYDGVMVDVIHAERTQAQRDSVVRAFRAGGVWVLICTELMGRGIDFKDVNLVINYDMPPSAISYIHRIGRTGRAGRPGKAVTFFTSSDVTNMRPIAHLVKNSGCDVPDYLLHAPKKNKKQRKRLAARPPPRASIDTTPLFEKERFARIKALQKSQDRRKAKQAAAENQTSKIADPSSNRGKRKREKFSRGFQVKTFKNAPIPVKKRKVDRKKKTDQ